MSNSVKLHVVISIDVDEQVDTGLSVDQWNALGDAGRQDLVEQIWNAASQNDMGGVSVITDGATGV